MGIVHDLVQEFLWSFDTTVSIGKGYEKYLLRGKFLETR